MDMSSSSRRIAGGSLRRWIAPPTIFATFSSFATAESDSATAPAAAAGSASSAALRASEEARRATARPGEGVEGVRERHAAALLC